MLTVKQQVGGIRIKSASESVTKQHNTKHRNCSQKQLKLKFSQKIPIARNCSLPGVTVSEFAFVAGAPRVELAVGGDGEKVTRLGMRRDSRHVFVRESLHQLWDLKTERHFLTITFTFYKFLFCFMA